LDAFACTQVVAVAACSWAALAVPVVILVWMVTLAVAVFRTAVAGFSDLSIISTIYYIVAIVLMTVATYPKCGHQEDKGNIKQLHCTSCVE